MNNDNDEEPSWGSKFPKPVHAIFWIALGYIFWLGSLKFMQWATGR
jgi:hypothetical protein